MKSLSLKLLYSASWVLLATFASAQDFSGPVERRPADKLPTKEEIAHPPKTWIDKDTGHRVIRLTDEPGSGSFYFNVNAFTPDGQEMVYTTPDSVNVLDLRTRKTRVVVKGQVHTLEVGHKTPRIFYVKPEERAVYSTNVDTGETRKLGVIPPRGNLVTINADETLAAGTFDEQERPEDQYGHNGAGGKTEKSPAPATSQTSPMDQPRNKGEMMERRLAARIPLVLFTLNLDNGQVKELLHSTDWVNHLLFSPSDPQLLMYCHEGPWQKVDRIWTIHTDGTHNQLMHKRTMAMEIAGHEFWGHRGDTVYYDLQTPKGEDFWLASLNLSTGERDWYHMDRNEWSIHFNVNEKTGLFAGDGGDPKQVARATDGEWINLFRPEKISTPGELNEKDFVQPFVFRTERLVNMSKHNYTLEPNVMFTPDAKMIIFRSNMFGPTYVFGVEVAKAKP